MGIHNGKCDSCNEEKSILFPLVVLDELPSGGEKMVTKYYCKECYEEMADTAETLDEDEEEEDEDKDSNIDKEITETCRNRSYCDNRDISGKECKFFKWCNFIE